MSWIQRLYETYERCADAPQFVSTPLPPIGHTTQQAHIEIVIDELGHFRRASVVSKEDSTTLVPCTEQSGGRSGRKPVNHPLCDKLQYVARDFLELGGEVTSGFSQEPQEPHRQYASALSAWSKSAHSHQKLVTILKYVERGRITHDLVAAGVLPVDEKGRVLSKWEGESRTAPPIFKTIANPQNAFVRWRVESPRSLATGTWEDPALVESWIAYYSSLQGKWGLCMVTGENAILAEQHPAKLRNAGDKAKLVSSNDTSGYTFRGRFVEADEACGVGFAVTQKAHNALRWLIQRQGRSNGDQVVVAWSVDGKRIPDSFANSWDLFGAAAPAEAAPDYEGDVGQAFAARLSRMFAGYGSELGPTDAIVIMALDSATPGRMAIAFYRELAGSEFLNRVEAWHQSLAWFQDYGWDPETKRHMQFFGAPSPKDIAVAAFGPSRDKKRSLHKATVERLLPCIVDGRPLPRDLVESTVRRTCHRAAFEKAKNRKEWEWEKNLGVACAVFRAFHITRDYQMTLEIGRTSRDYLYGRLLAIAEFVEARALYVAGESRDTTAAKLMQRFADRPFSTWRLIELALAPYKARLKAKRAALLFKMEKLLDDVVNSFPADTFLDDRPLSGEFLLGYHCQRHELNAPKSSVPADDEESTDNPSDRGDDNDHPTV